MVALMTRVSLLFLKGNLGIRLVTVILSPLTLFLLWKLADEKNPDRGKEYTFYKIAGSVCLFVAYGFYTIPDVPLLFFTAVFLYAYRSFRGSHDWRNIVFLAIAMAGLAYSKYEAVLVVLFVVLSNIRLLGSLRFRVPGIP